MSTTVKLPAGATLLQPQPGPQYHFMTSRADITIGGGGAGGGKTMALLLQPLLHIVRPRFGAVIFRREYPQITAPGALWDQSCEIYRHVGGIPRQGNHDWRFRSGAVVRFAHMQHEDDRYDWDGSEIPLICFDQAESFTWRQISYMFSRNRSTCGVKPYIRMTCNPDPDSWLREFLRWWINDDTGLAIPERSGKVRYFVNLNDEIHWAGAKQELQKKFGADCHPRSVTFIPSSVYDNKKLLEKNPNYLSSLKAMQKVERGRLLDCNWNIRDSAGTFFQRTWFEVVNAASAVNDDIRYWDRAATETKPGQEKKASWTAGVRMGRDARGTFYVKDVVRFQGSPLEVETRIKNVASQDGRNVRIGIEQDPGQAGKAEALMYVRLLAGYNVTLNAVREAKGVRARPLSAQVEAGNVKVVRGSWNDQYLREMENFDGSDGCVADQVDASSGAFYLISNVRQAGVWGR